MFPIFLGEASFLRLYEPMREGAPDNEMGNIIVGLCPTGTTLLVELAGSTISYTAPVIGNHVLIIHLSAHSPTSLLPKFCRLVQILLFEVTNSRR